MSIEAAAIAYDKARQRRYAARRALINYRMEHGSCDAPNMPPYRDVCYQESRLPMEYWCEVCQGSHPLWLERKAAAVEVGKTLRRLTYLCRKSPANAEGEPS